MNSELITNSVALLSSNTSTVTHSCISILSNPIFTITSLNMSPLSRLHIDVFSTILESIANLLLLRPSQGLPDLPPHLNYIVHYFLLLLVSVYIPVFFPLQFCSLFPYSCNSLPNIQIHHSCSSSYFPCLLPWHMSCVAQTLSSDWGIPLLHLFFPSLPLGLVLLEPAIEMLLASLAMLETVAIATVIFPYCSTLELVLHCLFAPSASLLPSYFPSNSCPEQLLYYTIAWLSLADILFPSTFSILFHLFLFWIFPLIASPYICFLLLFFWAPVQTPPLFFLLPS